MTKAEVTIDKYGMKTIKERHGLITLISHESPDNIDPKKGYPIGTRVMVYDVDGTVEGVIIGEAYNDHASPSQMVEFNDKSKMGCHLDEMVEIKKPVEPFSEEWNATMDRGNHEIAEILQNLPHQTRKKLYALFNEKADLHQKAGLPQASVYRWLYENLEVD